MFITLEKTQQLKNKAEKSLVGGVSAAWNHLEEIGPIYFKEAKGSHLIDVDGNDYIDYLVGWGSLFLGHNPKMIRDAVISSFDTGFGYQYETEGHIELAEKLKKYIPSADLVRLCNSGTEATMYAIRIARSKTGKNKILKFEGHFHGLHDYLLYSMDTSPYLGEIHGPGKIDPIPGSTGIPNVIDDLIITIPFNDIEAFTEAVKHNRNDLAAVIMEPISLNIGCVKPEKEFLNTVRNLTKENDIILIFDEVLTGFRLGLGGAQEYLKIEPDISCFGKALGSGMPIAAVVGQEEFMNDLTPKGKNQMSGTNTGRNFAVYGTLAVLNELEKPGVYEHIWYLNDTFIREVTNLLNKYSIPGFVDGVGGRIGVHFGLEKQPKDYREIIANFNKEFALEVYKKAFYEKGLYGVFLPLSNTPEPITFSLAHSKQDLFETLNRIEDIFREVHYFK
ncbi:aspartate aminotransferase family protein [Tepidibacillus infernus]|uniref:aspartate aminotransferase family protein n=1 Tax=Tepidibacillus infernus TaxID=1806172 RepID=UPI003B714CC3